MSIEEMYNIYELSIKNDKIKKESFYELVKASKTLNYEDKAFAIYNENHILLICVNPTYQKQGIGTKLLKNVELLMKNEGHKISHLGGAEGDFNLKGVPFENQEFMFFDKQGYEDTDILVDAVLNIEESYNCKNNYNVNYLAQNEMEEFYNFFLNVDYKLMEDMKDFNNLVVMKNGNEYVGFLNLDKTNGIVNNLFILPKYRRTEEILTIINFVKNEIKKEEAIITSYHNNFFPKNFKVKTFKKYYVGLKDLENERKY